MLQPDSVKIGLIGCGCSVATEPVAEISHRWNISQVYTESAVVLIPFLSLIKCLLFSAGVMFSALLDVV